MKRLFVLSGALVLFGAGLVGCSNTAEGAKQDASTDTQAVKDAGDKAVAATNKAASNAVAATDKAASNVAAATGKAVDDATAATTKAADRVASATTKAADNAAAATGKAVDNATAATRKAADNVAAATGKVVDDTKQTVGAAGQNVADNVSLRPKVKMAIINDQELNNTKNTVHVETAEGVVHIKGIVLTKEMKKRAGDIAEKVVKESGSSDKVINDLTVDARGDSRG